MSERRMNPSMLLLLFIGPILALVAQPSAVPQGYELITAWVQYGPLGLTAITAIIVSALLMRQLVAVNKDFTARLDTYQSEWRQSVERITKEHNETMKQVAADLREIIEDNTVEISKSTETRGEANQTIATLRLTAVCPFADRIEEHPSFRAKK